MRETCVWIPYCNRHDLKCGSQFVALPSVSTLWPGHGELMAVRDAGTVVVRSFLNAVFTPSATGAIKWRQMQVGGAAATTAMIPSTGDARCLQLSSDNTVIPVYRGVSSRYQPEVFLQTANITQSINQSISSVMGNTSIPAQPHKPRRTHAQDTCAQLVHPCCLFREQELTLPDALPLSPCRLFGTRLILTFRLCTSTNSFKRHLKTHLFKPLA